MEKNFFYFSKKGAVPLIVILVVIPLLLAAGGTTYYLKVIKPKTLIVPTIFQPGPQNNRPPGEVKIIDGNVCLVGNDGQVKVLVDKNRWQAISLESFSDVGVSPDGTKLCFLAHTVQPIWLFWSKIDGSNATKVQAVASNCVWSHNSQKIAFNNQVSDVSPVDVYVYDTQTAELQNTTEPVNRGETIIRIYERPEWLEGDKKIISKYSAFPINDPTNQTKGVSTIDLFTHAIEDQ